MTENRQSPSNKHTPESFAAGFWRRVEQRGPDECWPWKGTNNGADGRGKVHLGYSDYKLRKRRQAYAYVVSWQLCVGPVPDGMKVLHRCDNGNCVNPKHLFLGTQLDNIRDMIAKGRQDHFGWKKKAAQRKQTEQVSA